MPARTQPDRLNAESLAGWMARQQEDLKIFIQDVRGEVIAVSDVKVSVGDSEMPDGIFMETMRTFLPHGSYAVSNTEDIARKDNLKAEALSRAIQSFGSEIYPTEQLTQRADEFYTFLAGE